MKDRGNDRIFAFGSAGAKARAYFAMLAARLKPCPCYKACFDQILRQEVKPHLFNEAFLRLVLASILIFASVLPLGGCRSYHIDATLENRTGAPVQLLEVDYPSASFGADRLESGATFHYRFQVRGSGPLSIQYTDSNGHPAHINGPTLVEGEHGQLQIVLLPEAKAAFQMQLTPAP